VGSVNKMQGRQPLACGAKSKVSGQEKVKGRKKKREGKKGIAPFTKNHGSDIVSPRLKLRFGIIEFTIQAEPDEGKGKEVDTGAPVFLLID